MFRLKTLSALGLGIALAGPVAAGSPEGMWLTKPDKKGQVAHVQSTACGAAFCGKIVKVFDKNGQPVADAPNVGKRVFWDMIGTGNEYRGRAFVPAHNRDYDARMQVNGNSMKVSGCLGPVCQSQTWTRVK